MLPPQLCTPATSTAVTQTGGTTTPTRTATSWSSGHPPSTPLCYLTPKSQAHFTLLAGIVTLTQTWPSLRHWPTSHCPQDASWTDFLVINIVHPWSQHQHWSKLSGEDLSGDGTVAKRTGPTSRKKWKQLLQLCHCRLPPTSMKPMMTQGSNLSRSRRPGASKNKVRDSRIYCPLTRAGTLIFFFFFFFFFFFLGLLYINKRSIIILKQITSWHIWWRMVAPIPAYY